MNVITYARVSTDEQAEKGFSLQHQKEMLEKFCGLKNQKIIRHFVDDYSAKTFERPEWKKLVLFIKANRGQINSVLITKWDRFSRNLEGSLRVIRELRSAGVSVNAIEQPLDLDQPDSKFMLALYLVAPEVENDKISTRTKEGMRRAMKEGCFPGRVPFGYSRLRDENGKATLKPNKDSKTVLKAFELYATGAYSQEEIRRIIKEDGYKGNKEAFRMLLQNNTYRGKIPLKAYRNEEAHIVPGLHVGIISDELFLQAQNVTIKRSKAKYKPKKVRQDLPLRGSLMCPRCGRKLTGSTSRGRNGLFTYYHCQGSCGERIRAKEANEDFVRFIGKIRFQKEIVDLYKEIVIDVFKREEGDKAKKIEELRGQEVILSKHIDNAQDKFINNDIDKDSYEAVRSRYNEKRLDVLLRLGELQRERFNLKEYLNFGASLISDLGRFYENSPVEVKQKIIGSIFNNNLVYEGRTYRTVEVNEVISVISLINEDFSTKKEKQVNKNVDLSTMALPLGLEPRTL